MAHRLIRLAVDPSVGRAEESDAETEVVEQEQAAKAGADRTRHGRELPVLIVSQGDRARVPIELVAEVLGAFASVCLVIHFSFLF